MTDRETVTIIYNCYKRAMASIVGRDIKLPAHTDPDKTYAYRYIRSFIKETKGWNLNIDLMKALVREVVKYGKINNLLNKGLAILTMRNVLHICYDYLYNEEIKTDVLIANLKRSKEFIDKTIDNQNIVDVLVHKENPDGYPNIVKWFRQDSISIGYVSLSLGCRGALNMLSVDERDEFPSDVTLLRNRIRILSNLSLKDAVVEIMSSDLLLVGVE